MPRGTGPGREIVIPLVGTMTVPYHCDAAPPTHADGDDCAGSVDTAGNIRVSVLGPSGGVVVVPVNGIADTLTNAGTVTTPGATTVIVQLTAVPAGVYDITCLAGYGAVGDVPNNMKFFVGATAIGILLSLPGANSPIAATRLARVTLAGASNLTIQSIAAGGAGCVYVASITATRVS